MFLCDSLKISFESRALVDISFEIESSLALVGESGSGKSLTLKALIDMLPKNMSCEKSIECNFRQIRGDTISYIPQNPFTALSPLTRIKNQFFCDDMEERLRLVGLDSSLLNSYPPELSGGPLQRVIIAMSLNKNTRLMLLDEPTTALDTQNKEKIIELLRELQKSLGFYMLFVTHDIKSAISLCNTMAFLKDGRVLESGDTHELLDRTQNAYAGELISSGFAFRGFRD